MKKIGKITILFVIGIVILIGVDGFSAKYLKTRPLIAKKEDARYEDKSYDGKENLYSIDLGVVYKSLFADIYYCDTTVDTYNDGHMEREQKIIRYYLKKGEKFTCKSSISYYPNSEEIKDYLNSSNPSDLEYIKAVAKSLYRENLTGIYGINNKMGVMICNFLGYPIDNEYRDVYMFNINDFSKDPVKLVIDGFDLTWRSMNYKSSPSGNILSFYYGCGYKDQWAGNRKYSIEDCNNNIKTSGIYVFRVNGINDYEKINFYEQDNSYLREYPESYFLIDKVINDEEMIIKFVLTKNKQEKPEKILRVKWNFINGKSEEYSDE